MVFSLLSPTQFQSEKYRLTWDGKCEKFSVLFSLTWLNSSPEGVFRISSYRDDRMGAKIKTQKNRWTKIYPPKKSHAEFPSHNKNFQEAQNDITRKIERLVLNTPLNPYLAKFFVSRCAFGKVQRNFGFFCSVNHLSGPLRKHIFTCDWCISIYFVCFCVSRFVACDRPVSGNNRLVFFEDFSDHSYSCLLPSTKSPLIIVISFAFLEQSRVILSFCFCRPS